MSRVIGYLRVSTSDQHLEKNKAEILNFANERRLGPVDWVEETISGTVPWQQRELGKVMEQLQAGDTLIVSEISRFARSLRQILEVVETAKLKDVTLHALKGNWTIDNSLNSKVVVTILGLVSEIEKDLISMRTVEALAARKAAGVKLGRPRGPGKSKLDQFRPEIVALLQNGSRKNFIAARYGVTEPTLYNWLQKHHIDDRPSVGRISV
ncbi:MAG: recombinase family protein [Syntrophobacteraceae bacterium]|jgi:DNA invertase Pin-like site-specific DNA recombinase